MRKNLVAGGPVRNTFGYWPGAKPPSTQARRPYGRLQLAEDQGAGEGELRSDWPVVTESERFSRWRQGDGDLVLDRLQDPRLSENTDRLSRSSSRLRGKLLWLLVGDCRGEHRILSIRSTELARRATSRRKQVTTKDLSGVMCTRQILTSLNICTASLLLLLLTKYWTRARLRASVWPTFSRCGLSGWKNWPKYTNAIAEQTWSRVRPRKANN